MRKSTGTLKGNPTLHPEIIHHTRGPNNLRDFWKWSLEATTVLENNNVLFDTSNLSKQAQDQLEPFVTADWNRAYVWQCGLFKRFLANHGKTYYIPRDFFTALSHVNRDIRIDYYPDDFYGFFAFPKKFLKDPDGEFFNGVYVSTGKAMADENGRRTKKLDLLFVTLREGSIPSKFLSFRMLLADRRSFSEFLPGVITGTRSIGTSLESFRLDSAVSLSSTIANALLYVQNENDEIILLRAASNPERKNGRAVHTPMGKAINNCSIPVRLLSFNFHKRTHFSVDSTEVRGHFRWQPHGPGLSKVKLIWISSHTRHFSVDETQLVSAG